MAIDKAGFVHSVLIWSDNILPMTKMKASFNILILLFFLIFIPSICKSQLPYNNSRLFPAPDPRDWPNPYAMLKEKQIKGNPDWKWEVFAAYQGAPIERGNSAKTKGNMGNVDITDEVKPAGYLERFVVLDRLSTKLQVRSMVNQRVGWMDMRDLLLFARPLHNPRDIVLKAFLRVNLGRRSIKFMQGEETGKDLLRFRDGPGIPGRGNKYKYLISKDEVNRVSSLFLYIYAVHFSDDREVSIAKMEENINNYVELYNNLDKVDYVLLGTSLSFNAEDLSSGQRIRGWLPAAAVQFWETRQAVEQIPGTPAHQFKNRSDLLRYFALTSPQLREKELQQLEKEAKVQRAMGMAAQLRGQDMRFLVLDRSTQQIDTVLAGVSDIDKQDSGEHSHLVKTDVNRDQKSMYRQSLADFQQASKFLDLFFLVDGTTSMEGPVKSAAEVIEKLTEQIGSLSDVKVSIRAAVFRDQKDTTNPVFEDWDSRQGSPSDWLRNLLKTNRIRSGSDLDFNEALFSGIRSAIRSWKPHFQHTRSLRVMFVLGDAGDNSENIEAAKEMTRSIITGEDIALFPIHFNHPLKDDSYKQLGALSKLGAICEEKQWRTLISEMYSSFDESQEAVNRYANSFERISMCGFIEQMAELAKWDTKKVNSLTGNNIRSVLSESTSEYLKGAIEWIKTLQRLRQGTLNLPEAQEIMRRHGDIAMSIFRHRIRQMKQQIPELAEMLEKRPELAYSELYIAEEDGNSKLLRPVLLISQRELGKIVTSMRGYIQQHRQCGPDTLKMVVAESLTTLLGELLQLHPDLVTDADIGKWHILAVDDPDSYLGAPKVIEEYCRDNQKWVRFLSRLQQAVQSLDPMLGDQPHPRRFTDISGDPYFWLYPEELFPLPK